MSLRLNARFLLVQDIEMLIRMSSIQSIIMGWFIMEDLLLTKVSKPLIHLSLLLEVYVNSQEDIKL